MKSLLVAMLLCVPALAAIDGRVLNKTTNLPAAGINVSLVRPGQNGMTPVGTTTTDAAGEFHFSGGDAASGPQLLQANYGGINYNKLITPNMGTNGLEVDVYEATPIPAGVVVSQHLLIFDVNSSQIGVNETVMLQNSGDKTFHDTKGGDFRFYLPPAANGQVRISAQGPGGMPLPRPAERTGSTDVFKIDFPIKPGDSQFEINYTLPVGSPFTYQGKIVEVKGITSTPVRLVAPPGVTLAGKDVQSLGTEPRTQATIYNVAVRDFFSVNITGTGGFRSATADNQAAPEDNDSPPVTEGAPQIYAHLPWLVTLVFSILTVGLIYLYRSSPSSTSGK